MERKYLISILALLTIFSLDAFLVNVHRLYSLKFVSKFENWIVLTFVPVIEVPILLYVSIAIGVRVFQKRLELYWLLFLLWGGWLIYCLINQNIFK